MNEKSNWIQNVELIPKSLTLTGISKAARCTGLYIPEKRIMLDCGNPCQFVPEYIFITHGHMDHTSQIARILIDTGTVHPKIFCPSAIKDRIRDVIHSFFALTKNTPNPKVHNKYTLTGVDIDTKVPISYDKKDKTRVTMYAEIIRCHHTVPCVGYGFIEVRQKLRPEFHGKTQKELNSLTEITHDVEFPLFCYLGDTNERILNNNSAVLDKYKTVIIECSFLDPEHIQHAKKDRHIHWNDLKPYVTSRPDTRFILIHFSIRYSDEYIDNFFRKQNLANVVPFIQTSSAHKSKPKHNRNKQEVACICTESDEEDCSVHTKQEAEKEDCSMFFELEHENSSYCNIL